MTTKVSEPLSSRVTDVGPNEPLDVVFELNAKEPASSEPASRAEKIRALKEQFVRDTEELEREIRAVGGEITGRAWINSSVRAKIPAGNIDRVAALDRVRLADVPHPIERE